MRDRFKGLDLIECLKNYGKNHDIVQETVSKTIPMERNAKKQNGCLRLRSHFSRVRLCATPWTAAYQASVHGILQAKTLEWVAIAFPLIFLKGSLVFPILLFSSISLH